MLYRFKWLELTYCLAGHVVPLGWLVILAVNVAGNGGARMAALTQQLGTLLWPAILLMLFLCIVFLYSLLCSSAPVLMYAGRYKEAERIYKMTLRIRRGIPVFGATAREDFWSISLANCYREQKRYDEAEALYKTVLASEKGRHGWLEVDNGKCKAKAGKVKKRLTHTQ